MVDIAITQLPAAPLDVLEIWSNPLAVLDRFEKAFGPSLPPLGSSLQLPDRLLIRYEPTVWLVEGETTGLGEVLGSDGSLTAIGGGIVRVRLSGAGWRSLLMEHGVFDAESKDFAPGCSAATVIDHVNVRLLVESEVACLAYVPLSYARDMIHFWTVAAKSLV